MEMRNKIADETRTMKALAAQINITSKILKTFAWHDSSRVSSDLVYATSCFIFRNPLKFSVPMYREVKSNALQFKLSYLLFSRQDRNIGDHLQKGPLVVSSQGLKVNCSLRDANGVLPSSSKQGLEKAEYCVKIKLRKVWKGFSEENRSLKYLMSKVRHLNEFLEGVEIDHRKEKSLGDEQTNWEIDPKKSESEWERSKNKFTLVCENYDYIYNLVSQIQENSKNKKLDHSIVQKYSEMMRNNIALIEVEAKNRNPISLKSEGKYVYFDNRKQLKLESRRFQRTYGGLSSYSIAADDQMLCNIPFLTFSKQQGWKMNCKSQNEFLQIRLFEEQSDNLGRDSGVLMDQSLNQYLYQDYVLQQI